MPLPRVSIVIYSRDNPGGCLRLLKSIERVDEKDIRFEVVLVYQGFNEKVQGLLKEHNFSFELKLHSESQNSNRASGRNKGVELASHEIVLLLDSDLECSPGLIKNHLNCYREKKTIAVMGEQFLPPFVKKNRWYRFLDSDYRNIRRWSKMGVSESPPLRYVNTSNFSVRREVYLSCGGHDESISNHEAENIDLAQRINARADGKIIFNPEAVAFCQHDPLRQAMRERYEFGKEGIPKLLDTYPGIYGKLPSRFVRMDGFEPASFFHQLLMGTLFTKPFLVMARGVRLLAPEWAAFWMMRYMLQYYSVWGLRHALKQKSDEGQNAES